MEEARPPRRDPEPAPASLQLQFEQVSLALEQLRQTQDRLQEMETRLAGMTTDCAGILDRWAKNDERHAAAVVELHGRLSEWNDLERRLLAESATRVHQFERSLAHEWTAIRQTHEEPIHRLDAQAARIAEACVTAVDAALKKFDAAEARFAALEERVSHEMSELSREVREALAEMRHAPQIGPARPWSLDNVVRLHNELRAEAHDTGEVLVADGPHGSIPHVVSVAPAHVLTPARAEAPAAPARVRDTDVPVAPQGGRSWLRSAWVIVAIAVGLLSAYALYLRSSVAEGVRVAAARAEAAERGVQQTRDAAAQQIAEVERAATARIASAQEAATAAQVTTRILAAPDLIRFDLAGGVPGRRAAAQVLWSRSEGVAIHGAGLQAAPAGQAYQLWLLTPATATSAGVFTPDATGRVASTFEPPASLPRPIVAARVTVEPAAGSSAPAGRTALAVPAGPGAAPARTYQSGT
jgi:hypothetical protein